MFQWEVLEQQRTLGEIWWAAIVRNDTSQPMLSNDYVVATSCSDLGHVVVDSCCWTKHSVTFLGGLGTTVCGVGVHPAATRVIHSASMSSREPRKWWCWEWTSEDMYKRAKQHSQGELCANCIPRFSCALVV